MAEENKTEDNNTPENKHLEDSFKLFGIFRMPWGDIKSLSEEDRAFLVKRADEVEERAKQQQMVQQAQQQAQQQAMMQQQQAPMQQPAQLAGGGILTPEAKLEI